MKALPDISSAKESIQIFFFFFFFLSSSSLLFFYKTLLLLLVHLKRSFEVPQRGSSNYYQQHTFCEEIGKLSRIVLGKKEKKKSYLALWILFLCVLSRHLIHFHHENIPI